VKYPNDICTDLTLLSAALKKSMFNLAGKAYAAERQADSTKIEDLKLRLQLLQTKSAELNVYLLMEKVSSQQKIAQPQKLYQRVLHWTILTMMMI
jgi:hypothetical protein